MFFCTKHFEANYAIKSMWEKTRVACDFEKIFVKLGGKKSAKTAPEIKKGCL